MSNREGEIGLVQNMAANLFEQARWHQEIERFLFPKILGEGQRCNYTWEREALIAAASVRYANGCDLTLAKHARTTEMPFEEALVLMRASRELRLNPDFSFQLFNGDARPLVEEALKHASSTVYGGR